MEIKRLTTDRRFLFITDMHLMVKPISSMPNIMDVQQKMIRKSILPALKEYNITDIVQTGDLVHCGIQQKREFMQMIFSIEELKSKVDNLFMCIGNHFFLDTLNNPELYCIQPTDRYKAGLWKDIKYKIIETPDIITCGDLQINLAHYERTTLDHSYIFDRLDDTKVNVTVFHDDIYGHHNDILPKQISKLYNNIDIAIHGHIHSAEKPFSLRVNGRDVTVYIPGSMTLTSSLDEEYHNDVTLPIISVSKEGKVSLENITLKIFSEELTILKNHTTEEERTLTNIKKQIKENNYTQVEMVDDGLNVKADLKSLKDFFISIGFNEELLEIARQLSHMPISINTLSKEGDIGDDI